MKLNIQTHIFPGFTLAQRKCSRNLEINALAFYVIVYHCGAGYNNIRYYIMWRMKWLSRSECFLRDLRVKGKKRSKNIRVFNAKSDARLKFVLMEL